MNGRWLLANRDTLIRDLVRDFCLVHRSLMEQRRRFAADGAFSYSALRDLLGESMRKGVFWRLKDTAHHIFRNRMDAVDAPQPGERSGDPAQERRAPASGDGAEQAHLSRLRRRAHQILPGGVGELTALEALMDWCIGYAFHECAKLREDAFQRQHYASRLVQISRCAAVTEDMAAPLQTLRRQTEESSSRELTRILHVLGHGLRLLARYLALERDNTRLARWLACETDLARQAFGPSFDILLAGVCGGDSERLHLMAARDFLDAGRRRPAADLLARARRDGLLGPAGLELLRALRSGAEEHATDGPCAGCGRRPDRPCLRERGPAEPAP